MPARHTCLGLHAAQLHYIHGSSTGFLSCWHPRNSLVLGWGEPNALLAWIRHSLYKCESLSNCLESFSQHLQILWGLDFLKTKSRKTCWWLLFCALPHPSHEAVEYRAAHLPYLDRGNLICLMPPKFGDTFCLRFLLLLQHCFSSK